MLITGVCVYVCIRNKADENFDLRWVGVESFNDNRAFLDIIMISNICNTVLRTQ